MAMPKISYETMKRLRESDREKIARLEAELDSLRSYAHEATNAITGLTIGGSEHFGQKIGDIYTADLPFCIKRIRERLYASHNAKCAEIVAQRRAEALSAQLAKEKAENERLRTALSLPSTKEGT